MTARATSTTSSSTRLRRKSHKRKSMDQTMDADSKSADHTAPASPMPLEMTDSSLGMINGGVIRSTSDLSEREQNANNLVRRHMGVGGMDDVYFEVVLDQNEDDEDMVDSQDMNESHDVVENETNEE